MIECEQELLPDNKTQYKIVDNGKVYIITTSEEEAMNCYNQRKELEQ
tara:strand:- start:397 stop:537 length:141 start_codon:yes stop_codon:yes gene_type:complete